MRPDPWTSPTRRLLLQHKQLGAGPHSGELLQKHSPRLASRAALKGVDCEVEDKDAHDEQRDEEGRAEAQAGAVLLLAAAGAGELLHPLVHLPPGALERSSIQNGLIPS